MQEVETKIAGLQGISEVRAGFLPRIEDSFYHNDVTLRRKAIEAKA